MPSRGGKATAYRLILNETKVDLRGIGLPAGLNSIKLNPISIDYPSDIHEHALQKSSPHDLTHIR
jgi:hypothetical protein